MSGRWMRKVPAVVVSGAIAVLLPGTAMAQGGDGLPERELVRGTEAPDTLFGAEAPEDIQSLGGADAVFGGEGEDIIYGGLGADVLFGGPGGDSIETVGPFADSYPDTPVDIVHGGGGSDLITAFDSPASPDVVYCGADTDYAQVDPADIVSDDCEKVTLFRL